MRELTAEIHPRVSCSYLVVRSHVQGHKPLEEDFGGLVVAKEGISINKVAGSRVKQSKQTREIPKQDIAFPVVTRMCGLPSALEEHSVLSRKMTLGQEEMGN